MRLNGSGCLTIGVQVTESNALDIQRDEFHGDWNYTISPESPICSDSS